MNDETIDDRLERLWPHLGNMPADKVREHIRKMRADRRVMKVNTTKRKTIKASSDNAKVKAKKLLAGADPALLARLLKEIDGGGKG